MEQRLPGLLEQSRLPLSRSHKRNRIPSWVACFLKLHSATCDSLAAITHMAAATHFLRRIEPLLDNLADQISISPRKVINLLVHTKYLATGPHIKWYLNLMIQVYPVTRIRLKQI